MSEKRIPKLTHHKASRQAVVRLGGKDYYVGPWGSKTALAEYDRLVGEWLANGRRAPGGEAIGPTIAEMLAAFWDHAQNYYRHADGTSSNELDCFRDALRPLRRLYGHTEAAAFGPLALKAVRQAMVDAGLCRTNINRRIGRIRYVFRWAVENELVPASVLQALEAVAGLKAGRCGARESEPVRPVAAELVDAVLPLVSSQVAAMIKVQRLTAMRSGELVIIRGIDIDMSGRPWVYRPARHKTRHLGHDRVVFFGPRAREILRPFLRTDLQAYLFSPADADRERRALQHARRRTPLSCGNVPGSNVKQKPGKKPLDRYTVGSYARAITYACDRAFPLPEHLQPVLLENEKRETQEAWKRRLTPEQKAEIKAYRKVHRWHPHQLRHSTATELRKNYGLEPTQVILGHKTLTVTQIYAEKNVETAMKIMAEVG